MATYSLHQVDAFTTRPLGGNPCAIVFDADDLDEATMLAVAREMNLSETSFVLQSDSADFAVRYFTPAEEIPLAGHPTIATVHALVESGRLALEGESTTVTLDMRVGPIRVEIEARDGRVHNIVMTQKQPRFLALHQARDVLPLFNLAREDLLPDVPIQTVSTGTPQLMVPVRDLDALRQVELNIQAYSAYRLSSDFFSPHLFCLEGATELGQTFARHFGTPPDLLEDPFTGSATGGMAAYLWRYGLIDTPRFVAEQGHWLGRPGQATVEVAGPRHQMSAVKVGGSAVTVFTGQLQI